MDQQQWTRIQDVFAAALQREPAEREAFLHTACAGDAQLLREVQSLLRADAASERLQPALQALTDDILPPDAEIAHYRIRELLGRGAMGVVYRAYDTRLQREVALKFLSGSFQYNHKARLRFLQEARAASALDHPNICTIYEVADMPDGRVFIAMAYCDGVSLESQMHKPGLSARQALQITIKLADALCVAHHAQVFHRDLKPANVIVGARDQVRLVDFGIAKIANHLADEDLTGAGAPLGTLAYMSPEQLQGQPPSAAMDIWGLAVMFYEMLAGERPFNADNNEAMLHAIAQQSPPPLSKRLGLPVAVDALFAKAFNPDLLARYPSMLALLAALEALQPQIASFNTPHTASSGQRRQLTVVCCELLTDLRAGELDPEMLLTVVPEFHAMMSSLVARFGGHVLSRDANTLCLAFGYPHAYEDAAKRAARCVLAMRDALQAGLANGDEHLVPKMFRAALHCGMVVAPSDPRSDDLIGVVPQLARQLLNQTQPGQIALSESVYQLLGLDFACQQLAIAGEYIKGDVYQLLSESTARSRLHAVSAQATTPFFGREQEMGWLMEHWQSAAAGQGRSVLIRGDAGIGKSRCLQALKEQLAEASNAWLIECCCFPYEQNTVLYPVREFLRRVVLELDAGVQMGDALSRLESLVTQYGLDPALAVPLLADFLGIACPDYVALTFSPEIQRQKLVDMLVGMVLRKATHQPVLVIFEDLHWADATSLSLLAQLVVQVPAAQILLAMTCRPGFKTDWVDSAEVSHLSLGHLNNRYILELIRHVSAERYLSEEALRHLCRFADGVPLYAEELTKAVLATDAPMTSTSTPEIPLTLQDSLTARLDRLGEAKALAQLAATLGREFSFALLQAVSGMGAYRLECELNKLVTAELIYPRGVPPNASYVFKHALIQEAAYNSLLRQDRKALHQQIMRVLQHDFVASCQEQPQLLARHASAAGETLIAIPLWKAAGDRALAKSAYHEALGHYQQGLQMLERLPKGGERDAHELQLLLHQMMAVRALEGWSSAAVSRISTRALQLTQALNQPADEASVLFGLWTYYLIKSNFVEARQVAERCLQLAEVLDDADVRIQAAMCLGNTAFWMGDVHYAREQLQPIPAYFEQADAEVYLQRYGQDMRVITLMLLGVMDEFQTGPQAASAKLKRLMGLAETLQHPFTLAIALQAGAWICYQQKDVDAVSIYAERLIKLCRDQGFPFYEAFGVMCGGWVKARRGDVKGIAEIIMSRQQLIAATGGQIPYSLYSCLLADAYLCAGQLDGAQTLLADSLADMRAKQELFYEAELLQLAAMVDIRLGRIDLASQYVTDGVEAALSRSLPLSALRCLQVAVDADGGPLQIPVAVLDKVQVFLAADETRQIEEAQIQCMQHCVQQLLNPSQPSSVP